MTLDHKAMLEREMQRRALAAIGTRRKLGIKAFLKSQASDPILVDAESASRALKGEP